MCFEFQRNTSFLIKNERGIEHVKKRNWMQTDYWETYHLKPRKAKGKKKERPFRQEMWDLQLYIIEHLETK
jgi:hypothetical protein